MSETIRAYVKYNDYRNIHYYTDFEVVDSLPEVGDYFGPSVDEIRVIRVDKVKLDCEQGNLKVYDYDFYEVKTFDEYEYNYDKEQNAENNYEDYVTSYYYCIRKKEEN